MKLKWTLYYKCILRNYYFSWNQGYASLSVVIKEGPVLKGGLARGKFVQ